MNDEAKIVTLVGVGTGFVFLARTISQPGDAFGRPGSMLRIALGGSLVVATLLVLHKGAPKLATGFSWLFLAGVLFTYGERTIGKNKQEGLRKVLNTKEFVTPTRGVDYGDPSGRSADLNDWTGQRSSYWGRFPTQSFPLSGGEGIVGQS